MASLELSRSECGLMLTLRLKRKRDGFCMDAKWEIKERRNVDGKSLFINKMHGTASVPTNTHAAGQGKSEWERKGRNSTPRHCLSDQSAAIWNSRLSNRLSSVPPPQFFWALAA